MYKMDKKAFFDAVRPSINLTTQNVQGFDRCLDYVLNRYQRNEYLNINELAYGLATAFWETAQTMTPVKEAFHLSERWRRRNLRYFPWYGRGLIQTTWEANYKKMSPIVGVDLLTNPDLLLQWRYALPAWWVGMKNGLYTGKDLDDYIDDKDESDEEDFREYKNARRIVNGTDKAAEIARLALIFEKALKMSNVQSV